MFKHFRAILTVVAFLIATTLVAVHPVTANAAMVKANPDGTPYYSSQVLHANPVTHVVKSGETLSLIAGKYKISWQTIYCANQKKITNPDLIFPGERLKIPNHKISCKVITDGNTPTSVVIQQPVTVGQPQPPQAPLTQIQQMAWNLLPTTNRQVEYNCLYQVIMIESGWNVYADNPSSGAYGIPQALPGSKMAVAGPDWATNPYTQLVWMIDDYIAPVYGDSCNALAHEHGFGWY
jgi:LysM repeat protein